MFSAAANMAKEWPLSCLVKVQLEFLNENSTETAEELAKYITAQFPMPGICNF